MDDQVEDNCGKGAGRMAKRVAIIATLDTKEAEVKYLRDQFMARGTEVLIIDTSILGLPKEIKPDVTSETIARLAGTSIDVLRKKYRSPAVAEMAKGVPKVVQELYDKGRFDGLLTISGETGAHIAAPGVKVLPVGVPKLMISCIFQGSSTFGKYVGTNDVMLMHSVTDILGVNAFSRKVFDTAVAAMVGMVNAGVDPQIRGDNLIAATMFGNTTPVVMAVKEAVEKHGYQMVVFHPSGTGGRAMEEYIGKGTFRGVLDMTTQDITDEVFGGSHPGGPHRLEAAGRKGIPQVFVPGCMDFISVDPDGPLVEKYEDRKVYPHNPSSTLVRTTKNEMKQLGELVSTKLNMAVGPTVAVVPLRGMSMYNKKGYPLYDPDADRAFLEALKANVDSKIEVVEVDAHINDPLFADRVSSILLRLLEGKPARE